MPMALIDLAISVAFYDVHSHSGPILISPGPQGENLVMAVFSYPIALSRGTLVHYLHLKVHQLQLTVLSQLEQVNMILKLCLLRLL